MVPCVPYMAVELLLFTLILLPISENLLLLFVGGVVVATALEYVTAVSDGEYFPYILVGLQ